MKIVYNLKILEKIVNALYAKKGSSYSKMNALNINFMQYILLIIIMKK